MSKKDEIFRSIEEQKRLEAERKRLAKADTAFRMGSARMPLGCWMWIALAIAAIWYLISRSMKN